MGIMSANLGKKAPIIFRFIRCATTTPQEPDQNHSFRSVFLPSPVIETGPSELESEDEYECHPFTLALEHLTQAQGRLRPRSDLTLSRFDEKNF